MKYNCLKFRKLCNLPQRKQAFTLSEILITLGIIGIVAAITLPTVINKVNDIILISKAKKAYSNFVNVLSQMKTDYGASTYEDLFTTGETREQITEKIAKYYKGSIVCLSDTDKNCGNVYDVKKASNRSVTLHQFRYPRILLMDGTLIYIQASATPSWICKDNGYDNRCFGVHIDVNGVKSPNQGGADVHHIVVLPDKLIVVDNEYGSFKSIFSKHDKLDYKK